MLDGRTTLWARARELLLLLLLRSESEVLGCVFVCLVERKVLAQEPPNGLARPHKEDAHGRSSRAE